MIKPSQYILVSYRYIKQALSEMTVLAFLLASVFILIACSGGSESFRYKGLTLKQVYAIDVIDPSGLSFSADGNSLWTVSDQRGGDIYRISFTGQILQQLGYVGDDLEGITVDTASGTIYVVEERLREVRELDKEGRILRSVTLDIPVQNPNDGLEGITINPQRGELYVVNEKNPILFIRLDLETLSIIETRELNFLGIYRMTDVSGVYYDQSNEEIWFLSDESAKIVVTDLDITPRRAYQTEMSKGEGIAVDVGSKTVYIVNDDTDELYVFGYK